MEAIDHINLILPQQKDSRSVVPTSEYFSTAIIKHLVFFNIHYVLCNTRINLALIIDKVVFTYIIQLIYQLRFLLFLIYSMVFSVSYNK